MYTPYFIIMFFYLFLLCYVCVCTCVYVCFFLLCTNWGLLVGGVISNLKMQFATIKII